MDKGVVELPVWRGEGEGEGNERLWGYLVPTQCRVFHLQGWGRVTDQTRRPLITNAPSSLQPGPTQATLLFVYLISIWMLCPAHNLSYFGSIIFSTDSTPIHLYTIYIVLV